MTVEPPKSSEPPKPPERAKPLDVPKSAEPPKPDEQSTLPDEQFPEMAKVAAEAGDSGGSGSGGGRGGERDNANPPGGGFVPPQSALTEVYRNQLEQNLEAHRRMRGLAFNVVGLLSALYLICLLCVLWRFFDGELLAAVIGAPHNGLDWHVLVLIGIALVIFAAIPLSLVMALVKMISDKDEDGSNIKTPTVELGKVLYDLIKGFVASSGK